MKYLLWVATSVLLFACGDAGRDDVAEPPKKTVFDPMVEQLDRVKQQAETLPKERKDNLDRAIEGDAR